MPKLTLRLPDPLHAEAAAVADSLGIALNALLAVALTEYLRPRAAPQAAQPTPEPAQPGPQPAEARSAPAQARMGGNRAQRRAAGRKARRGAPA
jgi:hypothetical protein